ncbi:LysR substrate-binding domain-containing protein [Streptomyces sp. NPDC005329]|uniref:LysR substrate-binding domain-containing protein n=1 Tax=Streptomyces sp. NPDC005329 TaxID=3157034 RepID=UPI0033AE523D
MELLDRLVRSYNDAAPPRPARAIVGTPEDQLERLRSGRADIGLSRAALHDPGLDAVVLRQEPCRVLWSERHRLAGKNTVSRADLADEPLVSRSGTGTPLADPGLWPGGLPGRPGSEVSDGLEMPAVVRLGQACALAVPQESGAQAEATVSIPLADGPLVPLRRVWPRERTTPQIRSFVRRAVTSLRTGQEIDAGPRRPPVPSSDWAWCTACAPASRTADGLASLPITFAPASAASRSRSWPRPPVVAPTRPGVSD